MNILFTGAHYFGKHMHANPTLPQHNHTTSQNAFAADLNARMFLQPFYHCQAATGWVKAASQEFSTLILLFRFQRTT